MKYGVVGNQKGWSPTFVMSKLFKYINKEDTIISGGAEGVDKCAEIFAKGNGNTMIIHYPDNSKPSPQRYFDRNFDIAKDCDVLIAFDKKSGRAGTKNTIAYAKKLKRKTIIFRGETK